MFWVPHILFRSNTVPYKEDSYIIKKQTKEKEPFPSSTKVLSPLSLMQVLCSKSRTDRPEAVKGKWAQFLLLVTWTKLTTPTSPWMLQHVWRARTVKYFWTKKEQHLYRGFLHEYSHHPKPSSALIPGSFPSTLDDTCLVDCHSLLWFPRVVQQFRDLGDNDDEPWANTSTFFLKQQHQCLWLAAMPMRRQEVCTLIRRVLLGHWCLSQLLSSAATSLSLECSALDFISVGSNDLSSY